MKAASTIIFTGDIGFDRYMEGRWADSDLISQTVLDYFRGGDHVVANVEGALIDVPPGYDPTGRGMFCHSMNPKATRVLRSIRADIWNLANNHTMDMGAEGMQSTLRIAKREGARTIGSGMRLDEAATPVYLDEAGGIGLMAVGCQPVCVAATDKTPGCLSWSNMERIEAVIRAIKAKCRWCIVVAHGGEEFANLSSPYIRNRYLQYLAYGADLVVAHHPHICMSYETVGSKAIFYSLGNFIFDTDYQRAQFNTDRGILLKLRLDESSWSFQAFGTRIDRKEERIVEAPLPDIFTNITAEEYEKLIPLSSRVFIEAEKRRQIFMNEKTYGAFGEKEWAAFFAKKEREKSIPNELMDFSRIALIAQREPERAWEKSKLPKVVDYLLAQL